MLWAGVGREAVVTDVMELFILECGSAVDGEYCEGL